VAARVDADAEGAEVVLLGQQVLEAADVGALGGEVHVFLAVEDALGGFVGFLEGDVEVLVAVAASLLVAEELLNLGGGVLADDLDGGAGLDR